MGFCGLTVRCTNAWLLPRVTRCNATSPHSSLRVFLAPEADLLQLFSVAQRAS